MFICNLIVYGLIELLITLINNVNLWMKLTWTELLLMMKILKVIMFLLGQKMDETKGFNTIDFWALLYYHIQ